MSLYDRLNACQAELQQIAKMLPSYENEQLADIAATLGEFASAMEENIYERIYDDGQNCSNCKHNQVTIELYPYGNTVAEESIRECSVAYADCPEVKKVIG